MTFAEYVRELQGARVRAIAAVLQRMGHPASLSRYKAYEILEEQFEAEVGVIVKDFRERKTRA